VAALRLRRHALAPRLAAGQASPARVAAATCGIHAQVMSTTDLQVWARGEPATAAAGAVTRALWEERSVVRTWCMRGTLHLLTPEQLGLYASSFDPASQYTSSWFRNFEVTAEEMEQLFAALGRALEDGQPRTRRELAESVTSVAGERLGSRLRSGWGELLKPAARRGLLVNGPSRGQEVTFVRVDLWLGALPTFTPETARRELLRRYLHAYGPADRDDYARWLGTRLRGATSEALRGLGPDVAEVRVAGRGLHVLTADLAELAGDGDGAAAGEPVRLLAAFDPYVLSHANRDHLLDAEHRPLVYRTAGWVSPTVLAGGRIVGTWEHAIEGGSLAVRVRPFVRLSAALRASVRSEAARLAAHFDRRLDLYT
jgi:hypothetical protein